MRKWPMNGYENEIVAICQKFEVEPSAVLFALMFQLSGPHTMAEAATVAPDRVRSAQSPNVVGEIQGIVSAFRVHQQDNTTPSMPISLLETLTMQARSALELHRLNCSLAKTQLDAVDPNDEVAHRKAKSAWEWQDYLRRLDEALALILNATRNHWSCAGLTIAIGDNGHDPG